MVLNPVAFVHCSRSEPIDDTWGEVESVIRLAGELPEESLLGIEGFSHLEVIYFFHRSEKVMTGSGHPRENFDWPRVGIFSQRKKDRPNHLGSAFVQLLRRDGRDLHVKYLDAIDGTPVLDIKPVFREFLPQGKLQQPAWTDELMKNYW